MERNPKIMVVDDDLTSRDLVTNYLTKEGYEVIQAENGRRCLELMKDHTPDLILLDVMMPEIDGFKVCETLKKNEKTFHLPIVILSALNDKMDRVRSIELGADDFLCKPFDKTELLARVRSLLRIKFQHQQIIQANKMSAVATLANGVSHEFNNILAGISSWAQIALSQKDEKVYEKALENIKKSSDKGAKLVKGLQDYATTPYDVNASFTLTNINILIDNLLEMFKAQFENNNIILEINYGDLPGIYVNKRGMEEVFINIITNARDSLDGKEGKIIINTFVKNKLIGIKISDTGTGIPVEELHKIFEPFFTTKGSLGVGKIPGTGLGLYISYGIIRNHGGNILVQSEHGKGSTFTVYLPVIENREK